MNLGGDLELLRRLDDRFNARDIETVLAPDPGTARPSELRRGSLISSEMLNIRIVRS
jgi:hypothetical protein